MKPIEEERIREAFNYALRLISIRLRTKREISSRLRKKGYSQSVVDKVIERLEDSFLLNEEEFAREFVRSKLKRLWHPSLIERALKSRGIQEEVLERVIKDVDTKELILRARERAEELVERYGKLDDKVKRRIYSYFLRRGFPRRLIEEIMPK